MTLFFLHIMKTAGTAVHQQLSLRFPAGAFLNGVHHAGVRDRDPNEYQFIRGVVNFGYVSRFEQSPTLFTILRDPLERNLSAFSYFSTWTDQQVEYFRQRFQSDYGELRIRFAQLGKKWGLREVIAREPELAQRFLSNVQTRALMFEDPAGSPATNPEDWLNEALLNLQRFDVVGICERLGDSLDVLGHHLGWQGLTPIPRANVTKTRLRREDVDPDTLAILREWNRLDERLFEFASCRLEKQWKQMQTEQSQSSVRDSALGLFPSGECFTFSQPIHGNGWHVREPMGNVVTCWSRSDQEAWLDLTMPRHESLWFRARVIRTLTPALLRGLRIFVNGQELTLSQYREGKRTVIEAPIPAAARDRTTARIAFRVPEAIRPCDVRPGNLDERFLGIALESVSLSPEPPRPSWRPAGIVRRATERLSQTLSRIWSPQT